MDNKLDFLTYMGVGLYQISFGFLFYLIISILLGLPIIIALPYLNPTILMVVKFFGWILLINGIIILILPFLINKYKKNKIIKKVKKFYLIFNIGLTGLLIPIGPFIGFSLYLKLNDSKIIDQKQQVHNSLYFILTFISGFLHLVIGILLIHFLPNFLLDSIDLLFPYITYELIILMRFFGWMILIPGSILILSSFWAKKIFKIYTFNEKSLFLRLIRILVLISSILIIIVFPLGTFFGLVLIMEIYQNKH